MADFEKVGDLYDSNLGTINYINLSSDNADEIYIGSYPYQDCEVLQCSKCNQLGVFQNYAVKIEAEYPSGKGGGTCRKGTYTTQFKVRLYRNHVQDCQQPNNILALFQAP
jgi:hypothetical protein